MTVSISIVISGRMTYIMTVVVVFIRSNVRWWVMMVRFIHNTRWDSEKRRFACNTSNECENSDNNLGNKVKIILFSWNFQSILTSFIILDYFWLKVLIELIPCPPVLHNLYTNSHQVHYFIFNIFIRNIQSCHVLCHPYLKQYSLLDLFRTGGQLFPMLLCVEESRSIAKPRS